MKEPLDGSVVVPLHLVARVTMSNCCVTRVVTVELHSMFCVIAVPK